MRREHRVQLHPAQIVGRDRQGRDEGTAAVVGLALDAEERAPQAPALAELVLVADAGDLCQAAA